MGRTTPSFRIAIVWEEEKWKLYRKYLRNKNEKKLFTNMFSIATLYNSACSNAVNPIRIFPILMSITFHHYKILKAKNFLSSGCIVSSSSEVDYDTNKSTIIKQELDKWYHFSFVLRKSNRELFEHMLQSSSDKYSIAINTKGKEFSRVTTIIINI